MDVRANPPDLVHVRCEHDIFQLIKANSQPQHPVSHNATLKHPPRCRNAREIPLLWCRSLHPTLPVFIHGRLHDVDVLLVVWIPPGQLPTEDAGDEAIHADHDIAWGNIAVREDGGLGPRKHTGQCLHVLAPVVTEIASAYAVP